MSTPSAVDVYNTDFAHHSALLADATHRVSLFESMLAEIDSRSSPLAAAKQAIEDVYLSKIQSIDHTYNSKQDTVSKDMTNTASKQEELEEVTQSIKLLTAQVADLKSSKDHVVKSIKTSNQQETRSLTKSLEAMDKSIGKQYAEVEKLKAMLIHMEQKLAQANKERAATAEQIAGLERELPTLTASEVQPIEEEISALSVELDDLSKRKDALSLEIKTMGPCMSAIKAEKLRSKNMAAEKKAALQEMKDSKAAIDESTTLQQASSVFNNIKKMCQAAVKDGRNAEKRAKKALAVAKATLDKAVDAEEKKRAKAENKSKSTKSKRDTATADTAIDTAIDTAADESEDPMDAADRAAREAADRAVMMDE